MTTEKDIYVVNARLRPLKRPYPENTQLQLAIDEGVEVELYKGIRLKRSSEESISLGLEVSASSKDEALASAIPTLHVVVSSLALLTDHPMYQIDENRIRISKKGSPALPGLVYIVTVHDESRELEAALRRLSFRRIVNAALKKRMGNLALALNWFQLGGTLEDKRNGFLAYWVGIEVLTEGLISQRRLLARYPNYVRVKDIQMVLKEIGATEGVKLVGSLYGVRGSIVHHGESPTNVDYVCIRDLLRTMILCASTDKSRITIANPGAKLAENIAESLMIDRLNDKTALSP